MNRTFFNRAVIGFLIGLLLPLLGYLIVYFVFRTGTSLHDFTLNLLDNKSMASKILSLSVLINMAPFMYFNSKRFDEALRGVFVATMLYVILYILLKFVLN